MPPQLRGTPHHPCIASVADQGSGSSGLFWGRRQEKRLKLGWPHLIFVVSFVRIRDHPKLFVYHRAHCLNLSNNDHHHLNGHGAGLTHHNGRY